MKTIVAIAEGSEWQKALVGGQYTKSTIDSDLDNVGFLHCSFPDQTIDIANRHFKDKNGLVLLLIDSEKVLAPIKYEGALSGRAGTFPHIYGALNVDAVYDVVPLKKTTDNEFIDPEQLQRLKKEPHATN